ncbi:hypothetical protein UG46_27480 [Pseudomonas fluorescens]|jgi:uncharacterized protein YceK|uniref:YceK/YidQ family lipoprotein n=1 Tax=Pseudomonas fluorescens group TaxID=136843 RepID=UPI0005E35F6A|nr:MULTISPECIES: YceK/YidQ family lipoprotein [Pseudomonas fluorescens group]KJH79114.1 hypothetical protein UG46_27480 [Pseudomonas fluorescens]MBI6621903.1 YceK/YidQ family lipoprotein [Pseudomonas corrugata]MBI6695841.1 YceK/YidQ family lipoprotein [Pseudomonas corrugata]
MLKKTNLIIVFIVMLGLVGCGTLMERHPHSPKTYRLNNYYPAIQHDWELLSLKGQGTYDIIPVVCYLTIVCPFVVVASMPFDFMVDTLLLPIDRQ